MISLPSITFPQDHLLRQIKKTLLKNEPFNDKKISLIKTSDAKIFLIKLQQGGRRYSIIKTVRGVLRPAFQMAVDDDVLRKPPLGLNWLRWW